MIALLACFSVIVI